MWGKKNLVIFYACACKVLISWLMSDDREGVTMAQELMIWMGGTIAHVTIN